MKEITNEVERFCYLCENITHMIESYDDLPDEKKDFVDVFLPKNTVMMYNSVSEIVRSGSNSDKIKAIECFGKLCNLVLSIRNPKELFDVNEIELGILTNMNLMTKSYEYDLPISATELWLTYATLLVDIKSNDEARKAFGIVFDYNPVCSDGYMELAYLEQILGNIDEAVKFFNKGLVCAYRAGVLGRAYRGLAYCSTEKGDYETAVSLYTISLLYDEQYDLIRPELKLLDELAGRHIVPNFDTLVSDLIERGFQVGPSKDVAKLLTALVVHLSELPDDDEMTELIPDLYEIMEELTSDAISKDLFIRAAGIKE